MVMDQGNVGPAENAIERRMSTSDVAAALRRQITSARYHTHERLPSERALAEEFGVARGTLREALRQLEEMELVERRAGSGTYVIYSDATHAESIIETTRPLELVDARFAIEPHMCRLAVLHATDRDLQKAEEAMRRMELSGGDSALFAAGDAAFHLALAEATHNSLLTWMVRRVNEVRGHSQWLKMRELTLNQIVIERYNAQHRVIIEAIRARAPEEAAKAMRTHLSEARQSLVDVAGS